MAGLLEKGFLDLRDAQHALRETEGMRSGFWPQEHQIFSV